MISAVAVILGFASYAFVSVVTIPAFGLTTSIQ